MTELRPPNRFARTVTGAVRRIEGRKVPLGLAVAAVGVVLAWVAWASVNGVPLQDRYEVKAMVPADAPILQKGDAVRIAGRLAGIVTGVEPAGDATEVQMELRPQYAPIGRNARANVRVKSLIYLTYLELIPRNTDDPLPEGETIPLKRSGSGVDLLEVVQLFDREARTTLRDAVFNAGVGLADRGDELNAALADLPEITRHGTPELRALTRRPGALAQSVSGTAAVVRGLRGDRPDDVESSVSSASALLGTVAGRSAEVGDAVELLRPLEDELLATAPLADPLLEQGAKLNRELRPVIAGLADALPDLNRTLALGDELRIETDRLTGFMRPVIRAAIPVVRDLRVTVASIDPLLEGLNTLIETLDPYAADITESALGLISSTSVQYDEGQTAPGANALRFAPILTCHRAREPYPAPGTTEGHSQPC
jgi:virulence factor Mce-like protein